MTEKSGSWSLVEIDNLITLISERRDLYDQSSSGYSNLNTTDTLWRQISSQFPNRNEQELRKKWRILRTGYRTRRGEKYLPSGSGAKPIKKWVYFDSLMFLEPYMTERNTWTNLKKVSNNTTNRSLCNNVSSQSYAKAYMLNDDGILVSDEAKESDQNTEEYNSQTNPHVDDETYSPSVSDAPSTPERPTSGSRKKRKSKLNPVDERFLTFFEKKHESTAKREKSSNELFLASLLEDMNKLQQDDLRKFKIIMLSVFQLAEGSKAFTLTSVFQASTSYTPLHIDIAPKIGIIEDECCIYKSVNLSKNYITLNLIRLTNINLDELNYAKHKMQQLDQIIQENIQHPLKFQDKHCSCGRCCAKILNTNISGIPVTQAQLAKIIEEERTSEEMLENIPLSTVMAPKNRRSLSREPSIDFN
ncbi:hypothetical protein FQA39_LY08068 [Lamprigera yunnana]|nr:hypothetical protein FQA39_LY08068 [Lamprigera yunnana]